MTTSNGKSPTLKDSPSETHTSYSVDPFPLEILKFVEIKLTGLGHCPSFKNRKRTRVDRKTLKPHNFTDPKHKKRMDALEDAITLALFSWYPIDVKETRSECLKQLRTLLSGLCDDSIQEIPCGTWATEHVKPGEEGLRIRITKL